MNSHIVISLEAIIFITIVTFIFVVAAGYFLVYKVKRVFTILDEKWRTL